MTNIGLGRQKMVTISKALRLLNSPWKQKRLSKEKDQDMENTRPQFLWAIGLYQNFYKSLAMWHVNIKVLKIYFYDRKTLFYLFFSIKVLF